MNVSRETGELLQAYAELIRKWSPSINLISSATLPDLEFRHIADSAQLSDLAQPESGTWLDIGSGGGLPGVVLAILLRHLPVTFTLVESDKRKSAFLLTARRKLGLSNLTVKSQRVELLESGKHRYVSARAFAPLEDLMPHLQRQLASDGEAWLLKGRSWEAEVAKAAENWNFDLERFQSRTDPEAAILKLRKIGKNA